MIDTHCHMDLYAEPSQVARDTLEARIETIAVTNLPSAFRRAYPFVGRTPGIHLALGMHPLVSAQHAREMPEFQRLCEITDYIGEIGLDFSPAGYATRVQQVETLRVVLRAIRGKGKVVTLHSRRAEAVVLSLLREEHADPVIFHWYTGPLRLVPEAVNAGHYFSVNPAMVLSPTANRIIAVIPPDRVLPETDGPFVQVQGQAARPTDVAIVEDYLASLWRVDRPAASAVLLSNFRRLRQALSHPIDHG